MATPSSSATSPSPTMPFSPPLQLPAPSPDLPDQDHRKRAVEKFKARAEISNVTRSLRARLSYASYKATHNVAGVPLRDLEAQTQSQALIYSRTMAAKRKASAAPAAYSNAPGNNNYYNNPATQGGASNSPGGSGMRRPGMGAMAPPQNAGPRTYYPPNAAAGGSGDGVARHMPAQSLFTSILAPPPSQQARTILNVADPPVPPPTRPTASPRPRTSGKPSSRSIAEGTRAMAKTRRDDKPERRKAKRPLDKGKQRQRTSSGRHADVDADGDVDMKAAATLTSLLLNHRPSIGSASSPRSSLDDDESGPYAQQFAQSSARHGHGHAPQNNSGASTSSGAAALPEFRRASATPPPTQPTSQASSQGGGAGGRGQGQTTPRPAPTDNEAADLMLFLATSPSPVRKGNNPDLAAYRALNGGGLGAGSSARPRGRVLFPTAAGEASRSGSAGGLARGGDSFTSSVSSIGGEMRGSRTPTPAPPPPFVPTQLLPPPPLPTTMHMGTMAGVPMASGHVPSPTPLPVAAPANASPKPQQQQMQQQQKPTAGGLRADVGRKLFEEEQMRHHGHAHGKELGAGIDLVQQS
ncbi:hypothetical protein C8F04DRAFT_960544 [Mycena alexandri]|uniref:Uncharacterized protein n=1 Tax=Mycena alexandri TaxID=1745969 RepID=A0AAD6SP38_9AGAR|nr:hypothetical protein C8F04DRAFT_960544 [Mycena alexandri]